VTAPSFPFLAAVFGLRSPVFGLVLLSPRSSVCCGREDGSIDRFRILCTDKDSQLSPTLISSMSSAERDRRKNIRVCRFRTVLARHDACCSG